MSVTYRSRDWDRYRMDYREPHKELEPLEREVAVVDEALTVLRDAQILPDTGYDSQRFLAHRQAVAEHFEIPWTAITPRMQRLLYAICAIHQPAHLLAAGVFCGNTFISMAGAAAGPGACYEASGLLGVEIQSDEAARAERNVRRIDSTGVASVRAADAIDVARHFDANIDLLYLDADGTPEKGKGIYLDILKAAWRKVPPGAIVLAHNSVNAAGRLKHYLEFVRSPKNMRSSVNVVFDPEGLEVSLR